MSALYGVESFLALALDRSTLAGWRPVDFLLHHLPYASVVGGAAVAGVPVFAAFPRTLPLTLLTCPNEAVTILFALGLPRAFDAPNRLYLLLVMLALIPVELVEIAAALLFGAP